MSENPATAAPRQSGHARRLIYVIGNEILGPVVESQVYRPLAARARQASGTPMVIAILPAGYYLRPALTKRLRDTQQQYLERYGIPTRVVLSGTSRTPWHWLQVKSLRRRLLHELAAGTGHQVFGRNCISTCLVLDALAGHHASASVIYDCRGDDAFEQAAALGGSPDATTWPAPVREGFDRMSLCQKKACAADSIIVVSKAMGRVLHQRHGAPWSKISVRPCAVDLQVFVRPDRTTARARLGLEKQFVVCYLGSLAWYQRPDQAIRIFQLIKNHRPDALFLAITTEPAAFEKNLAAAGLKPDAYRILSVPSREVPEWLPAADVGLLLRERHPVNAVASPVKCAEYLACGVPVLLSPDIGDYSNLISETRLGGVVDIAESNDVLGPHLATLTEAIIADPDCRLRARRFAEHSLSLDSVG